MKTNKNTPKKIKVEVEIDFDLERFPRFEDMEKEVLKKIEEAKKNILKQILGSYEEITMAKVRYVLKDRRPKNFQTILGELQYSRYRVHDRKKGCLTYPLDEWLDIQDHQKVCGLLKKEIVRLAVDCPFRFVTREINHWTGNQLNKDIVWSIAQSLGEKCWEEKNKVRRWQRHEPLPKAEEIESKTRTKQPEEVLCIGLDGTYVKRQENKKRVKSKHDVKVAVLYTGKKRVHGDMKLTNRQTVIQGRFENLDSFLGRVVAKAIEHYGLNQNTTVLLFGDGDAWIKRFKEYVPQAHYRLDPWHVFDKIKLALNITEIPQEWVQLTYGSPDSLIAEIIMMQKSLKDDPTTSHQKINELIQYLKNNREGLLPWRVSQEIQKRHKPLFKWGSGHVESQIEIAVYDRHKLNRMSWSKLGLHNLSTLREDKLNCHKKPEFACSRPPIPVKIDLGSLGCLMLPPNF